MCKDFPSFILLNDEISRLASTMIFNFRDEILLRQTLRLKNYEFLMEQVQENIGMMQMSMIMSMDAESLDPFSTSNIEAQRTKEYEKVEEGEIHNIGDLWKPEK